MVTTTNLQEEIAQQINIGFTKAEIEQNLLSKGFTNTEINEALAKVNFSEAMTESNGGSISTKSILFGALFVVAAFVRFARYSNTGSILAGLGVITAIGMAIYFFTKRS